MSEHWGAWGLGVLASACSSLGTATGLTLQKRSHTIPDSQKVCPCQCRWSRIVWILGFVFLVIMPAPLDMYALSNAPQSLLAPLSSITLVFNAALAHFFQNEQMVWLDFIATALICGGSALTTAAGDHSSPVYDSDALHELFSANLFLYVSSCSLMVFFMAGAYTYTKVQAINERNKKNLHKEIDLTLPLLVSFVAAGFGSLGKVFLKAVSELLKDSIIYNKDKVFTFDMFCYAGFTAFLYLFSLWAINFGLKNYDQVLFVPIFQSFSMVEGVAFGLTAFQEYRNLDMMSGFFFGGGVLLNIFGCLLLLARSEYIEPVYITDLDIIMSEPKRPKKEEPLLLQM